MPLHEEEFHLEISEDHEDETDSNTEDENGRYEMEEDGDISEHSSIMTLVIYTNSVPCVFSFKFMKRFNRF